MFFDLEDDLETAAERYTFRIEEFKRDGRRFPRLRHHGFWVLHNSVVHPLLGLFPGLTTVRWHEVTSRWLNHIHAPTKHWFPTAPKIPHRFRWIVHNSLSHMAIGLVPCARTFRWHDQSAEWMDVPSWV